MSGDKKDNDEGLVSSSSSTLPKKRRLTAGYWLQSMVINTAVLITMYMSNCVSFRIWPP